MTNKFRYFIANWKMFGNLSSLKSIDNVIKYVKSNPKKKFKLIYCPPYTLLQSFHIKLKKTKINLGAQNCHEETNYGPFTGKINSKMIKSLGAKYVIIGHSENRQDGENDSLINKKIISALKNKLSVIFCVGETLSQKRIKLTRKILMKQLSVGLKNVPINSNIIIAYEPVWSIGTGLIPKKLDLSQNIDFIKAQVKKKLKFKNIKIIYGGSVNPNNIAGLNLIDSIDGYLIGGASQSSKKLIDILRKSVI
tara:strand:- start:329 stop:1081 length:753 start_codon:yes stop_codon:yes gene_type:complete